MKTLRAAAWAWTLAMAGCGRGDTITVERTDYRSPPPIAVDLVDDTLADPPPPFVADRVAPTRAGDWEVNLSGVVFRLDVPMVRADLEPSLGVLRPSYAAAVAMVGPGGLEGRSVLVSVNMVDGKAKQFDDGLLAAIQRAGHKGDVAGIVGLVDLMKRLAARVGPDGPASPFLAAGLELAGVTLETKSPADKARWLGEFRADEVRSKPIGFSTWDATLAESFRFARFFQRFFGPDDRAIPRALASALLGDPALLADYRKALALAARLGNPAASKSVADLVDAPASIGPRDSIALFPPFTSRESELFDRLFAAGLPPGAALMRELISRIRSGRVDLHPRADGGWYDHQVHALETMLLPEKGDEHAKLLLSASYKRRMLDAFQALITKRRESHVLGAKTAASKSEERPARIAPTFRVEPCPSYFLRTARAYSHLADSLETAVGEPALRSIRGLREGGERSTDLWSELAAIRTLFFGLHLVSLDDLGMEPTCLDPEGLDPSACRAAALAWLARPEADADLAVDTRISAPIFVDRRRGVTRLWATLGVRLAKLDASFARPPKIRIVGEPGDWTTPELYTLDASRYLIPVDEFAEVELRGLRVLARSEFRRACDEFKAKDAILGALAR